MYNYNENKFHISTKHTGVNRRLQTFISRTIEAYH